MFRACACVGHSRSLSLLADTELSRAGIRIDHAYARRPSRDMAGAVTAQISNVLLYIAFMLHEALLFHERRHSEMQARWSELENALHSAEAAATSDRSLHNQAAHELARTRDEMAEVKAQRGAESQRLHKRCAVSTSRPRSKTGFQHPHRSA